MLLKQTVFIFAFAALSLGQEIDDELGCFTPGECTGSLLLDEFQLDSANECLEACQGFDDLEDILCEAISYYLDSKVQNVYFRMSKQSLLFFYRYANYLVIALSWMIQIVVIVYLVCQTVSLYCVSLME